MRRTCLYLIALTLLFVPGRSTLASGQGDCSQTLRVPRMAPYDPAREGADLQRVLALSGCRIDALVVPVKTSFPRRLSLIRNGQIDMMSGISYRPERAEYAWYSIPYRTDHVTLWARRGEAERFAGRSLVQLIDDGVLLAGPEAGWFGADYEALRDAGPPGLHRYRSIDKAVRLLRGGRVDLVLIEYPAGQSRWPDLEPVGDPLYVNTLHFFYSRKTVTEETVEAMDRAIAEVFDVPLAPR